MLYAQYPIPASAMTSPPHALFLSTLVAAAFAGPAFFVVPPAGAFFAAGAAAAFLAGALAPFLTTVDAVSVLTLLEALTLLAALAVALAAPAPGPALAPVFARFLAAAVPAPAVPAAEAAAALRAAPPRTDFAFSTMPEKTPVRGAGFAGEEGRAMRDFEAEAGRSLAGGRREFEEAGERI